MFSDTSVCATAKIVAMVAAVKLFLLPPEGLQGAKPIVVGRLSTRVQESAWIAVAIPLVVVSSWTAVAAEAVIGEKDSR